MNNVLTPITTSLSVLKLKMSEPRDLQLLDTLEAGAGRAAEMVRQILSFARGVEGRSLLLRPKDVVQDIEKLVNDSFPKSISFKAAYADDVWNFEGDPTQLHQVLLNLCVNARDAMPGRGILSISVSNVVIDKQFASMNPDALPGPKVLFEVRDNGVGISAEIRDRMFEPFFTTKKLGKGTGLGLSTTLGIVRSHHGFIDVSSRVGQGTTFRVYLPARMSDTIARASPLISARRDGRGELIMVVDDEKPIREATSHTLEIFGYRVMTASDGAEAIAMFFKNEEKPAVILTDMMMPVMDGPALIRALHKIQPGLRIIGASGLDNQLSAQAMSLGVRHFLRKPYTAEDLLGTLDDLLHEKTEVDSSKLMVDSLNCL